MGIIANVTTAFGEDRDCYIRLNSVEVSNHDADSVATFRAFLTKDAYESGAKFVSEYSVSFDADVSKPIWAQAYAALSNVEKLGGDEV